MLLSDAYHLDTGTSKKLIFQMTKISNTDRSPILQQRGKVLWTASVAQYPHQKVVYGRRLKKKKGSNEIYSGETTKAVVSLPNIFRYFTEHNVKISLVNEIASYSDNFNFVH